MKRRQTQFRDPMPIDWFVFTVWIVLSVATLGFWVWAIQAVLRAFVRVFG